MDRSTSNATTPSVASMPRNLSTGEYTDRIEAAAQSAHTQTDRLAESATAQVERMRGSAHRAVDGAAAAAQSAADRAASFADQASSVIDQAKQTQASLTEAAATSIRTHPLVAVSAVAVLGYLLGRLARL